MMWWWGDHWGVGGWIGVGFTAIFWVAVIVGVVYLIRHLSSRSASTGQTQSTDGDKTSSQGTGPAAGQPGGASSEALRILEERYARGEIDREEFLQRKNDISP